MKVVPTRNCVTELFPFFHKEWSSVSYAKGDNKGSIGTPFLSIWGNQTGLIMAATWILLGFFS